MHEIVIQKINAALDVLNFSYRIFLEVGTTGCMYLYKHPLSINSSVSVRGENIDKQRADQIVHNHLMSAVSSLVLILDEALCDTFKTRNATGHTYIDDLRTVIYMLRCAFAHGPCDPKWEIKSVNRKRISLSVSGSDTNESKVTMNFDFAALHAQQVQTEHFYGLKGLILLSLHTQRLILEREGM